MRFLTGYSSQHTNETGQPRFLLIVDWFVTATLLGIFHSKDCYTSRSRTVQGAHVDSLFCLSRIGRPREATFVFHSAYRAFETAPSLSLPGPMKASLLVSKWLRRVVSTLPNPSRDDSTKKSSPRHVLVATWLAWCHFAPSPPVAAQGIFWFSPRASDALRLPHSVRLNKSPWPGWTVPAGGMRTMNSSIGECTNTAVMSNNPMYLVSFEFLLAANDNSVRQTASGDVLCRHWPSQLSPYNHLDRTFVRDPTIAQPQNLKHIVVLHVLEFLSACFFSLHRDTSVLQISWRTLVFQR